MSNHSSSLNSQTKSLFPPLRQLLILVKFFLIIFAYHLLRDLKDTFVVTSCDAGPNMIPFIKVWGILPAALLANYLFQKVYHAFGRAVSFNLLMSGFITYFLLFAFYLFPANEKLCLHGAASLLEVQLPESFAGFTNMIRYWNFSLFYICSELWSVIVITMLFWNSISLITPVERAKEFYPLCILIANISGIVAGETSYYVSHYLNQHHSWEEAVQILLLLVVGTALAILLSHHLIFRDFVVETLKKRSTFSFRASLQKILSSPTLFHLAILVIGFALIHNLVEVVWKSTIKQVYKTPREYNAYCNQITIVVGFLSLMLSFFFRFLFKTIKESILLILTPLILFVTSVIFFSFLYFVPVCEDMATLLDVGPHYLVMTLGSVYYVSALVAKYSIFDTSKEMAFLAIDVHERPGAKSMIDSIGTRCGKTGSSLLHQLLLVMLGSSGSYECAVTMLSLLSIGTIFMAASRLSYHLISCLKTTSSVRSGGQT